MRAQDATPPDGTAESGRNRRYGDPRPLLSRFWNSDSAVMLTMAALVGVAAGLGAVLFIYLIDFFRGLFTITVADLFFFLGSYYLILLPVFGGLLVGPLIYYLAPEAKGHGVPEVMAAMETKGGRIRPRVILVKTVASALTIAVGGSVGREGPIVQIGAAFGSAVGQRFRLNQQ
ncbi:MAG TPA: chloride channel protein, partial [Thermoleophilia bacterium]|nr:chloride channel protein [Thermoleophilia bacterium]